MDTSSENMITTSNGTQYLRPDYPPSMSSTLDSKKSPLALLAQTCSQIGADSPVPKSLLATTPSSESKQMKKELIRDKSSPSSSSLSSASSPKSSFRPYEDEKRVKTPGKKESSPRASPIRKSPETKPTSQEPLKMGLPAGYLPYPAMLAAGPYHHLYPRMKTSNGDVCRDPYCTGCQLKPCPCAQCEKAGGLLPHHAAAYAHLAALAASQPYVCSWIGTDASYCGKRFTNSEDLLSHLRSHTSDSMLSSAAAAAAAAAAHPLLARTYPTPPLSPLPSSRYHPYSKPPLLPPSLASFPPLPHPALPPYFPPYSLYPRLGASHP